MSWRENVACSTSRYLVWKRVWHISRQKLNSNRPSSKAERILILSLSTLAWKFSYLFYTADICKCNSYYGVFSSFLMSFMWLSLLISVLQDITMISINCNICCNSYHGNLSFQCRLILIVFWVFVGLWLLCTLMLLVVDLEGTRHVKCKMMMTFFAHILW